METGSHSESGPNRETVNGTPPERSDYVLKFYTLGELPARTERLGVETIGQAIDVSKSRVRSSTSFSRGLLYCDGSPIMEFTRDVIRWANVH